MARLLLCAVVLLLFCFFYLGDAIQCYQCDSDFDANCWPDRPFDRKINALVDCLSDEAHTPGTYCVKKEYRSSGWWGWHKVTRRCGASTTLGSINSCVQGMEDTGVYIRECNCDSDGCNSAVTNSISLFVSFISSIFAMVCAF